MDAKALIKPSDLRPLDTWLLPRVSMRITPEGFTETVTSYIGTDVEAVQLAAERVIAGCKPRTNTKAKIAAAQLVAHHVLYRVPLPAVVLRALAAAMAITSSARAMAKRVRPDPWPEATEALQQGRRVVDRRDLHCPDRRVRKQARKALAWNEISRRAIEPVIQLARWWVRTVVDEKARDESAVDLTPKKRLAKFYEIVVWFSEREEALPAGVFHAVVVALGLTERGRLRQYVFEKILSPPPPRFTTEWGYDDESEPVVRAVPIEPETRHGLRHHDSTYRKAIELETAARIVRGHPGVQAMPYPQLVARLGALGEKIDEPTIRAWGAESRWKRTTSSRALHPIRNAIQQEVQAKLADKILSAEDLAKLVRVEPVIVKAWRREISAADVAKLVGVKPKTVEAWWRDDEPWSKRIDAQSRARLEFAEALREHRQAVESSNRPSQALKEAMAAARVAVAERARTADST